MPTTTDKSKSFPLAGVAMDGWSTDDEATATCFCGAVQLKFPTSGPGLIATFVCNCADCHKITASMFASNFTVDNKYLTHIRGQDNMTIYEQSKTIGREGNSMANYFCKTCGTLMYRCGTGFPGQSILRIGTVDDFSLHETKLKPQSEFFMDTRPNWLPGVEGVTKYKDMSSFLRVGKWKSKDREALVIITHSVTAAGGWNRETRKDRKRTQSASEDCGSFVQGAFRRCGPSSP